MRVAAARPSAIVVLALALALAGGACARPAAAPVPGLTRVDAARLDQPVLHDAVEGDGEARGGASPVSGPKTPTSPGYSGHGASSVSPEVLARYAPKPLPSSLSRHIQAMLDVRAPGAGVAAPDGQALYFPWAVTGTSQVWKVDGPRRFAVQLTGGEDATNIVAVTPDGKQIVVSRDRKGEENPGLYVQSASGGALAVVQHKEKVQTFFQRISDDGKWLYFSANDVDPKSYAIYRWDFATHAKETVFDQPGLWALEDARDGGKLLLSKHRGELVVEYHEWDPATKTLTPLVGTGENEEYEAMYAADPGELVVLTPKLGEYRRLYRMKGTTLTAVTPEMKHDVSGFTIDRTRARILYTTNEGGFTRLGALDAKTYQPIALPPLPPGDHVSFGRTTQNGRFTAFTVETSRAPATSFVYDWKEKKLAQWHVPSAPEIDTSAFAVAKLESYPAKDGTKIPMFVRRPEKCAEPCPVIVSFHGGPEGQARPGFSTRAQIFVDAGFVYVEPNVRGSDGYGKTWLHADDGPKRLDVIGDIEDCAKFIRREWAKNGVAPKIGIMGGSYGGYSTLVGMTMFAGTYDAGVAIVGMSNLLTFLENTAPYRRQLRASEYGDPEKDRDALLKLSPITYIDRVSAPLLLIQGASDPRVPVGEAIQMHDALEGKKVPAGLVVFADEGHGSQKRENRVLEIGHALEFFERHLVGTAARAE